mmetsp:Transcript_4729/g.10217  ORF Transcript_4729/g.10217 Transcript_4729/m.10217 type:complete len:229 (-) Transcript_4729:1860-2546(-)
MSGPTATPKPAWRQCLIYLRLLGLYQRPANFSARARNALRRPSSPNESDLQLSQTDPGELSYRYPALRTCTHCHEHPQCTHRTSRHDHTQQTHRLREPPIPTPTPGIGTRYWHWRASFSTGTCCPWCSVLACICRCTASTTRTCTSYKSCASTHRPWLCSPRIQGTPSSGSTCTPQTSAGPPPSRTSPTPGPPACRWAARPPPRPPPRPPASSRVSPWPCPRCGGWSA